MHFRTRPRDLKDSVRKLKRKLDREESDADSHLPKDKGDFKLNNKNPGHQCKTLPMVWTDVSPKNGISI